MAHLRPASEGFENSDRDYENVMPPHLLRLQQLGTEPAQEAKPDVPASITLTDNTRGRSWKTSIVILYLLVCVSLLIATAAFVLSFLKFFPHCPYGWQTFRAKCYLFSMNNVTWMEAKGACQSLGAHLVVIGDDEEAAAEQMFLDQKTKFSYWIGLKNYENRGLVWVNGTPQSGNSQLKRMNKTSCVYVLQGDGTNKKTQSPCSTSHRYICEKQPT